MMKSSHGNRLSSMRRCPHCQTEVNARTFRLDPRDATQSSVPAELAQRASPRTAEQGQALARAVRLQRTALRDPYTKRQSSYANNFGSLVRGFEGPEGTHAKASCGLPVHRGSRLRKDIAKGTH